MRIALTEEQRQFRDRVREQYAQLLSAPARVALRGGADREPTFRAVIRDMGRRGLLGVALPAEHGGGGGSAVEQFLAFDEAMRADGPAFTTNALAPALLAHGSAEQRQEFVPKLLSGEITICIGYSEPGSGSDLASLTTRAVRDGDEYVINGHKTWTSAAAEADYIWLAARTDPAVKKHKGISLFLVPMGTPGIEVTPIRLLGDQHVNQVHLDDVRVPAGARIGAEHDGWRIITSQLNYERVVLSSSGVIERALEEVLGWAASTLLADGRRVLDEPWVQLTLARVRARLEFLRLLNWRNAWAVAEHGEPRPADASATKVFGGEFYQEAFGALMEVVGAHAVLSDGGPGAVLHAELERAYRDHRILTFAGGTSEIQRALIAAFGLGMPRAY
jgi:3-oxocholest-4-en-26-oyl-CoA dehydrogenase alpha subunit